MLRLGVKKALTSLSRRTTNVFVSNCTMEFSTMASSKESDCDNDRKPEIAIWPLNRKYFSWTRHGRKTQNSRWNFDAIYHSSRDVFPVLAAILLFPVVCRCRNHLATLWCRWCRKVRLLLELQQYLFWICFVILVNMTIKFRQFQKKSRVWRHAKQFPVHRLATWLLHFVPTSYSGKVMKGQRPMLNRIFSTE